MLIPLNWKQVPIAALFRKLRDYKIICYETGAIGIDGELEAVHIISNHYCFCWWHDWIREKHPSPYCRGGISYSSEDSNSFIHYCFWNSKSNYQLFHRGISK